MNSRQVTALMTINTYKSFSKAAEKLYLSPQALMKQIQALENEIGFIIFKRSYRGVELTEQGRIYIEGFVHLQAEYSTLLEACCKQFKTEQTLTLGTLSNSPMFIYSKILPIFNQEYPNIRISFTSCPIESRFHLLRQKKIDLCLSTDKLKISDPDLLFTPLFPTEFSCVVSKQHPLANQSHLLLSDLKGMRVACANVQWYCEIQEQFSSNQVELYETDFSYLKVCFENGIYLSEVPNVIYPDGIISIPLNDTFYSYIGIASLRSPSSAVQSYIEIAKNYKW